MKTLISLLCLTSLTLLVQAQPANDFISSAIDLGYGPIPYVENDVDFINATLDDDETPQNGCPITTAGVWYKFTATNDHWAGAAIANTDAPLILFFEAPNPNVTSAGELTYINYANNPCEEGFPSSIPVSNGTTYYLFMKNNVVSDITIYTENVFIAPENDLLIHATEVTESYFEHQNIHYLTSTNTDDGGQDICDTQGFRGVWHKITAQQDGMISALLSSPPNNSITIFYTSDNPSPETGENLVWVEQDTNFCGFGNYIEIEGEAGKTYYIFTLSGWAFADVTITSTTFLNTHAHSLDSQISFYPNPVKDKLHLNGKTGFDKVKIYDLNGREAYQESFYTKRQTTLDLSMLKKGIYIMQVFKSEQSASFKLIKT